MEPTAPKRLKTEDGSRDVTVTASASFSSTTLSNTLHQVLNNKRKNDDDVNSDKSSALSSVESDANALLEAGILPRDLNSAEYYRLMKAFKFIGDGAIQKKAAFREDGIMLNALQYLDVVTLIQKKPVCKKWQSLCTRSIDEKCCSDGKTKKAFQTNQELKDEVNKYSPPTYNPYEDEEDGIDVYECTPVDAEKFASNYGYPIDKWDVSNVQDFTDIFRMKNHFNESIASWDVSNATNMKSLFHEATLFNQPIGSWDVSNATNMSFMFQDASSFNQDISSWDVSNVRTMANMFLGTGLFNQDISTWDVSNVTDMIAMFAAATSFNQDISAWDVSNVTDMRYMFYNAKSFNQDISAWDVSNVNRFKYMFYECPFRQLPWFTDNMQE